MSRPPTVDVTSTLGRDRKEAVMLKAHPAMLRKLVAQYEALALLHADRGDSEARRRLDDAAYTLCVSTGTRNVSSALTAARRQLQSA